MRKPILSQEEETMLAYVTPGQAFGLPTPLIAKISNHWDLQKSHQAASHSEAIVHCPVYLEPIKTPSDTTHISCRDQVYAYNATFPQYMRDFASGQVIAEATYFLQEQVNLMKDFQSGCFLLEPSGKWQGYDVTAFQGLVAGLNGFVFTQAESHDAANEQVKVGFRGTKPSLFDRSVWRDSDSYGPGFCDFIKNHKQIIEQFDRAIAGKDNVELTIGGHSLGGSDAQYFLVSLLKGHYENGKYNNISKITIDTYNSPSAHYGFYKVAQDYLQKNSESLNPIKIEANIGMSDADAIQHIGYNIFYQCDPHYATVNMVKMDKIEMLNSCESSLGSWLFDFSLQFYEYLHAHSLVNNYFSPDEMSGKIRNDTHHDHWSNTHKEGLDHINAELGSWGHITPTAIVGLLRAPHPLLRGIYSIYDMISHKIEQIKLIEIPKQISAIFDKSYTIDSLLSLAHFNQTKEIAQTRHQGQSQESHQVHSHATAIAHYPNHLETFDSHAIKQPNDMMG